MIHMTHLSAGDLSVIGGRQAILVQIADDAMRSCDWEQAQSYFHQARDLTSMLATNSPTASKMHYIALNLARIEYHKGNYSGALAAFQKLVCSLDWLMPSDIEILAVCNEKLGRANLARELHEAACEAQLELDSL